MALEELELGTASRVDLERVPGACKLGFTLFMEPRSVQFGARMGVTKAGRRIMFNDPSKVAYFKEVALHANRYRPTEPFIGPLRVDLTFVFSRPMRLRTKRSPDGLIHHIVKPDRDNCAKGATDALSECGFWLNDCQIYTGMISKYYAEREGRSRIEVLIWEAP